MGIRDVQDAQRPGARRQDGDLELAQGEPVPLDYCGITEDRGASGGGDWDECSQSHPPMVPWPQACAGRADPVLLGLALWLNSSSGFART